MEFVCMKGGGGGVVMEGSAWRAVCMEERKVCLRRGGLHGGGLYGVGLHGEAAHEWGLHGGGLQGAIHGGTDPRPLPRYGQLAFATHPTGMHTC